MSDGAATEGRDGFYPIDLANDPWFGFLYNVGDLESAFEVIPGHVVDRATPEQISFIRKVLSSLTMSPPELGPASAYENRWTTTRHNGGATSYERSPLQPADWRYYVVNWKGTNMQEGRLRQAFMLIDAEPLMLFGGHRSRLGGEWGTSINPTRAAHHLWFTIGDGHLKALTIDDLNEVRSIADKLETYDHSVLDLRPSLGEFEYLAGTDINGRLRLLGHFAIIEALVSHAPKPGDPYDSISRQVTNKMILIGNRIGGFLHDVHFGTLGPDKLWKKLYGYRSAIAHGTPVDFDSNPDLKALKSAENVFSFVRNATRRLLRFALAEPVLLRDLKGVT